MEVQKDAVQQLCANIRSLSQRVATYNQRLVGEGDALAEDVKSVQKKMRAAWDKAEEDEDAEALEELAAAQAIFRGHGPGGDLRKLLKQNNPALLSMLLGASSNVVTLQRAEGIRLKEEYHAFRDRTALLLFAGSSVLLVLLHRAQARVQANAPYTLTPPIMVGVQMLLLWMLYFFTGMALRESVLKVNGSAIRPWWIHHHYWGIGTCMLLLTLPVDSPAVQFCVNKFLWWAWWQSIVMILQNSYQRTRLYTRIALGKARAMDVVSGESSGNFGQLVLLYPLLFWLQALQANIGVSMMLRGYGALFSPEGWLDEEEHSLDLRGSRGVLLTGCLMLYMAVCNFRNTIATILAKQRVKLQRRAGKTPVASPDKKH